MSAINDIFNKSLIKLVSQKVDFDNDIIKKQFMIFNIMINLIN